MNYQHLFNESLNYLCSNEPGSQRLEHYISMKLAFKESYTEILKQNKELSAHIHHNSYDPHNNRYDAENLELVYYYLKDEIIENENFISELVKTKSHIIEDFLVKHKPIFSHYFLLLMLQRTELLEKIDINIFATHFDLNIQFNADKKEPPKYRFNVNAFTPFLLQVFDNCNPSEGFIDFFKHITYHNYPDRDERIALYKSLYKNCKHIEESQHFDKFITDVSRAELDTIYNNLKNPNIQLNFILSLKESEHFQYFLEKLDTEFAPNTKNLLKYLSIIYDRQVTSDDKLDNIFLNTQIDYNELLRFTSIRKYDSEELIKKIDFFVLENFVTPDYMKHLFIKNYPKDTEKIISLIEKSRLKDNLKNSTDTKNYKISVRHKI